MFACGGKFKCGGDADACCGLFGEEGEGYDDGVGAVECLSGLSVGWRSAG